ncbi:hypothetical protein LIER_21142 [Lithospermum erythrorhizon]|uniref:Uncharacterized protein n=1 Tax=Lithospermum erythrorhizon TaxID=34254 RepID=A0AAV3QS57_LITER
MLVDTGSLADILYLQAYDQLGLPRKHLKPNYNGESLFHGRDILDSSYNGLIGRPLLNALRAVVSPLQLKMKFPTSGGIGEISRDQKKARVCYQLSIPRGTSLDTPPRQKRSMESRAPIMKVQEVAKDNDPKKRANIMKVQETSKDNDPKERASGKHGKPHKELELVPFRVDQKAKTFRIGTKLPFIHRKELIHLVREFEEVFAWGPEDMPGVDAELSLHRLHIDSSFRPVKQKTRNFSDEKNLAIQKEIEELVKADAIREL